MISLASDTTGDGPSIVLLHANGGDRRDYAAIVPGLVDRGWQVTRLDWPGHGATPVGDGPVTAVSLAGLLIDELPRIGGGPHVLVGNSVGGFAAIAAAARVAEHVRALVLVSPGGFTPRWPGTVAACRAIGSSRVAPRAARHLPRAYLRGSGDGVQAALERGRSLAADPARVEVYASLWRSFADPAHDARPAAAELRCPVLLAWGDRDPILPWPVDGRRARRALPTAEVVRLHGRGHQPFLEDPDGFLAAVDPFLAALAAPVAR